MLSHEEQHPLGLVTRSSTSEESEDQQDASQDYHEDRTADDDRGNVDDVTHVLHPGNPRQEVLQTLRIRQSGNSESQEQNSAKLRIKVQ